MTVEPALLTFVDDSRPAGDAPARTLPTELYLPAGTGRAPLVVFAHGLGGHPRKFTGLLSTWANAGYAIAAPAFPLTSEDPAREPLFEDVANQPADVSFVLDEVLASYPDLIDPERIAVAGFSLGAITAYAAAFDSAVRDARFTAALAMSGLVLPFGGTFEQTGIPLLVVLGEHDPVVAYADALAGYRAAGPPKALVTLHVPGHHEPFEDGYSTPADALVRDATTAFLDLALGRDAAARARERLLAAVREPVATLETDGL